MVLRVFPTSGGAAARPAIARIFSPLATGARALAAGAARRPTGGASLACRALRPCSPLRSPLLRLPLPAARLAAPAARRLLSLSSSPGGTTPHGVKRSRVWSDMDPHTRSLWERLGWNAHTWANGPNPPSDGLDWDELGFDERDAAMQLGYTEYSWDDDDGGNPFGSSASTDRLGLQVGAVILAAFPLLAAFG
eukprot:3158000-Prymnesium_polylepis.1